MANTKDASELVRQSFKFFDSEGVALVALMKNGSDAMKEFFNDAENLGGVLSRDAAKGVADFADEFTRVKTGIRGVIDQFTAGLAPILEQVSGDFAQFVIDLNKDIEKLGFESLGDYLAVEFIEIIKNVIEVFGIFSNTIISIINRTRNFAASFGLIDVTISEENIERIKELERARDSLLESRGKRKSSKPEEFKFLRLIEEEIKKLNTMEQIQPFDVEGTLAYIDSVAERVSEKTNEGTGTVIADAEDKVSRFARTAEQALTNFKKESIEGMMVKGFEDAFKSAEDALLNFVQTGKLNFKDLVQSIIADLARIQIRKFLTGGDEGDKGFNLLGKIGDLFRADGGAVKGGQPYIVGERGAELFVPNSSGQIITNENTKGMMQKQQPVSVNFSIQATDASGFDELLVSRKNQIVAMISQAMNQKGKVGLI
jgi:hypothetical protein